MGSGCGSVGRVVASNSRGPQFESSHWQHFILNIIVNCIEKTKIKKQRPGMAHFFKKRVEDEVHSRIENLDNKKNFIRGATAFMIRSK